MPAQRERSSRDLPIPIDVFIAPELANTQCVPSHLVGMWVSASPAYEAAAFERLLPLPQLECIRINIAKYDSGVTLARALHTLAGLITAQSKPLSVCLDTGGRKVRVRGLRALYGKDEVDIYRGEAVYLTWHAEVPLAARSAVVIPIDSAIAKPPATDHAGYVFISDGWQQLRILKHEETGLFCEALHDAVVYEARGVTVVGLYDHGNPLSVRDLQMLQAVADAGVNVDYVGLSFTNTADDVHRLRRLLEDIGLRAGVIAKIETRTGLANADTIIAASDGVMVARGDLAIELAPYHVDMLQVEDSIRFACARLDRTCIVATRVADSILDGATELDELEMKRLRHELGLGLPLKLMLANETVDPASAVRNYEIVVAALHGST